MASPCAFTGNPETYGLGLRLAFYLFWYIIPLTWWIARSETRTLRFILSTLTTGYFLGLLAQVSSYNNALRPVEIYIGILLSFGGFVYLIPLYIWRVLTCFRSRHDPEGWARVREGPVYRIWNYVMLLGITVFWIWFWARVGSDRFRETRIGCQEYGFFFGRVRLDGSGFVAGNLVVGVAVLAGCVIAVVVVCGKVSASLSMYCLCYICVVVLNIYWLLSSRLEDVAGFEKLTTMMKVAWARRAVATPSLSISSKLLHLIWLVFFWWTCSHTVFHPTPVLRRTDWEFDSKLRRTALQEFLTFLHLLTISIVVTAIELTISWNSITGINNLATPAQAIPFVLGIAAGVRVLYIAIMGDIDVRYSVRRSRSVEWAGVREWSRWFGIDSRRRRRRRRSRSSSWTSSSHAWSCWQWCNAVILLKPFGMRFSSGGDRIGRNPCLASCHADVLGTRYERANIRTKFVDIQHRIVIP